MEFENVGVEDYEGLLDFSVLGERQVKDLESRKGLSDSRVRRDNFFERLDKVGRHLGKKKSVAIEGKQAGHRPSRSA